MKKKVIKIADTVFWYLLYFFPVVAYLFFIFAEPSSGTHLVSLTDFFASLGIDFFVDNIILTALNQMFGPAGILPFFGDIAPLYFVAWYGCMLLVHLMVDFLIFIPKLCHKWLCTFTRSED